ncbi:acyl carrier protein phosphodiesterase [Flavobacterium sp.]|uniref:acyl carrier protein phosphodiesterase n=1 Tax=Flavobacterium sp. TaxID=239 RepID=UPI001B4AA49A|nr:acyl carrier protein phosphodiesterase [Flavobacterium sp.]MBP6181879.1 acyl carrier protein phosphodiesterase [Flavobacterium sp.]
MNFLAHIYLSGNNDLIKIGNFMADGIRGKDFESYPLEIQKGILLHREIDTYTDAHPIFRQSTKKLHEKYHHYAGVIVDVFYDHFLAKNWKNYSEEKLEEFVEHFYQSLHDNNTMLSKRTKEIMPYMIKHNWLVSYQTVEGINRILTQMDYRTKNESKMRFATNELSEFYIEFENEFTNFFEELRIYVNQKIIAL